jgi:hypothetical protein
MLHYIKRSMSKFGGAAAMSSSPPLSHSLPTLELLRLASIRPPPLGLLHRTPKLQINSRRRREAETLAHFHQIQVVHIEDASQTV